MKGLKYVLAIIIGFSVVNISLSQSYDPQKKFTVDQLKEDFATLQRLFEENHPALYRYYDEKFFVNYFDSVYMEINTEMTELEFTLPNTKIRGKVARTTFETAVYGLSRDRGIIPDYYVEFNIKDIIENKDTIMNFALRLISEKTNTK
jgi:hypothetical protein